MLDNIILEMHVETDIIQKGNKMSSITINGKTYVGRNISIINNKIYIDDVEQESMSTTDKELNIQLSGTIKNLHTDRSVTVSGGVVEKIDANGSVSCGDVIGNVDAGGSVSCGNVGGNVDAGGSVSARSVTGNIDAGGSVRIN